MANLNKVIEGLQILDCYYDEKANPMKARQDQIWMDVTDFPVKPEDAQKMIDLGWLQPENTKLSSADQYDPDDYWLIYP